MIRNELTLLGVVLFVLLTVGGMLYLEAAALRPLRFINARVRSFLDQEGPALLQPCGPRESWMSQLQNSSTGTAAG